MVKDAIGLIETRGLVGAIVAADAAAKAGHIEIVDFETVGGGVVSVRFCGDVAAVTVALEAGAEVAESITEIVSQNVIPAPHNSLSGLLNSVKNGTEIATTDHVNNLQDLESLSVTQLRRLVRQHTESSLKGRSISRANKKMLIDELNRLKHGTE